MSGSGLTYLQVKNVKQTKRSTLGLTQLAIGNLANQRGLTLAEVLIAVVILSIGLLGIAGLQLTGLRGAQSANLRTQATVLANDIAERIRANPTGALNPVDGGGIALARNTTYADVSLANIVCDPNEPGFVAPPRCSKTPASAPINCSTRQMAIHDISVWLCGIGNNDGVQNLLPTPVATISCTDLVAGDTDNCSPGSTLSVNVGWNENDAAVGNNVNRTVQLLIVP